MYSRKQFDSLVVPILMYGSEIWGFYKRDDIEKFHLRFLKQIFGVRRQTSNMTVYGELGRFPLYVLRKIQILKYWFKIINAPDSLLYKAYLQQVEFLDVDINFNCWVLCVRNMLTELFFHRFVEFTMCIKITTEYGDSDCIRSILSKLVQRTRCVE